MRKSLTLGLIVIVGLAANVTCLFADDCTAARNEILKAVEEMPVSLAELNEYPVTMRRVIYAEMPPANKYEMWRSHLTGYMDANPDLTYEQLQVLDVVVRTLSVELFEIKSDDLLWEAVVDKPLEGLYLSAEKVFAEEELHTLFTFFDSPDAIQDGFSTKSHIPACNCSTQSDYCSGSNYCATGPTSCASQSGCGFWGMYTCNGLCYVPDYCGDGTCNGSETCSNCSADCGSCCGDGTCTPAERLCSSHCAADCGPICME